MTSLLLKSSLAHVEITNLVGSVLTTGAGAGVDAAGVPVLAFPSVMLTNLTQIK